MITIACFGTVLQCFRNISGISEFYIEILSLSVAMNEKKKRKEKNQNNYFQNNRYYERLEKEFSAQNIY